MAELLVSWFQRAWGEEEEEEEEEVAALKPVADSGQTPGVGMLGWGHLVI